MKVILIAIIVAASISWTNAQFLVVGGGVSLDFNERYSSFEVFESSGACQHSIPDLPKPLSSMSLEHIIGETTLVVCGGQDNSGAVQAECYQWSLGDSEWQTVGTLAEPRAYIGSSFLGNRIYSVAGLDELGEASDANEYYRDGEINSSDSCPISVYGLCVVTKNERSEMVALGGLANGLVDGVNDVNSYSRATSRWASLSGMPVGRYELQCGEYDDGGKTGIVAAGGFTAGDEVSRTVDLLNDATGVWEPLPSLPEGVRGGRMVTMDGFPTLIGGTTGAAPLSSFRTVQLRAGEWVEVPELELALPRVNLGATTLPLTSPVCEGPL